MTAEQLAAMHRLLLSTIAISPGKRRSTLCNSITSILRSGLADDAALIPRRAAFLERVHEREQQKMEDGGYK
jgi:hypothetical protein